MGKIIRTVIMSGQKPTEEQIREIEAAGKRPVFPDEDCPELTPEEYREMAEIAGKRRKSGLPGAIEK